MSDITKRAISVSLKKLLCEKSLSKITVQDIADDCGINRQTFYYHFQDIYDLVEWTCIEDTEKVLKENRTYDTWQEGFLAVFALAKKDKVFIDNIYRSVSLEMLEQYLYRLVYPLLKNVVDEKSKGFGTRIRSISPIFINTRLSAYFWTGFGTIWAKAPKRLSKRLAKSSAEL